MALSSDAVYCTSAMRLFGERVAELLGARLYVESPVGDVDRVVIVGMYDPPFYNATLSNTQRAKHRHIHWCGTDVLLLTHPELLPSATHSCDGDALQQELYEAGIDATAAWTPTAQRFEVRPLPPEKRVGVYLGNDARKYGISALKAVIEAMPDHEFVTYHGGQIADMQGLMGDCRAYLRLTRHDGGACSAREYMEAGRRAVVTTDLPYASRVRPDDVMSIVKAVRKATSYDEPDWEAAAFYHAANDPSAFVEVIQSCQQ